MDRPALPKEDLFEASTMTFGEHLEELRKALARAIAWWAVGGLIALLFAAQPIVRWIQVPVRESIIQNKADRSMARFSEEMEVDNSSEAEAARLEQFKLMLVEKGLAFEQLWLPSEVQPLLPGIPAKTPPASPSGDAAAATATEKAEEPTKTEEPSQAEEPAEGDSSTATTTTAATTTATPQPVLPSAVPDPDSFKPFWVLRQTEATLNSHKVEETFMIYLKAAIVIGSVFASPMIFYHLWGFVAAGLYPHERRYVYVYLPFSVTLFVSGVCLAFFAVLGFVLDFLLKYNSDLGVDTELRLSYWMNFVLLLPLGFGIAFQLPLVMLFLQRIGIFETSAYEGSWRIAVLVISLISMVLTPADPYSMILLMVPLVLLYFLGIGLCRLMPRGRGLGSAAYDPR